MASRKYTRQEVEAHVGALKSLLADVGPDISAALTQLVLTSPHATKDEALAFLAQHLAGKVGGPALPLGATAERAAGDGAQLASCLGQWAPEMDPPPRPPRPRADGRCCRVRCGGGRGPHQGCGGEHKPCRRSVAAGARRCGGEPTLSQPPACAGLA